jgi:phosphate:Na+ symporter
MNESTTANPASVRAETLAAKQLKWSLKALLKGTLVAALAWLTFGLPAGQRDLAFKIFGGLAIFLYGMKEMTSAFEILAGERIKKIFDTFTGNRILGFIAGITVTALIQSSSATTVMVVGFVNSAMMTLTQAASIIIGANIGTTITGQLIAFKISHYALMFILVGVLMNFMSKSKRNRKLGQAFIGFGLLFVGMDMMKEVVAPLRKSEAVIRLVASLSGSVIAGVFVGTIFTVILQSSSATVAITMTMAASGLIDFPTSVALILGDNIGTTITALLASLPARRNARRAALIHTIYNVLGMLVVVIIFPHYLKVVMWFTPVEAGIARAVANAHTIFNVVNAFIFLPLTPLLAWICYLILPRTEDELYTDSSFLDKRLLEIPSLAIGAASRECDRLSDLAGQSLNDVLELIEEFDYSKAARINEREKLIDSTEGDIIMYLTHIEEKSITHEESLELVHLLHQANDLERVGDQCENIVMILTDRCERKISFGDQAVQGLREMSATVKEMYFLTRRAVESGDRNSALRVLELEGRLNFLEKRNRDEHVDRLASGECNFAAGFFFLDLMEKIEKIGDHCTNMAEMAAGASH